MSLVIFSLALVSTLILPSFETMSHEGRASTPVLQSSSALRQPAKASVRELSVPHKTPPTGEASSSVSGKLDSAPPPVNWNEQLGLTISQNRASLTYNITAVEQSDSDGYGPAYIINGLTNQGDWYQVGLAYDWPLDGGGYYAGFAFLYEAFNSYGVSVFPSNGGGGLLNYSGPVNEGDEILLSLNFTGSLVVMYSHDWNTDASATANYTADGGDVFLGLQSTNNVNGYFSGLMTEQYHVLPYLGPEAREAYVNPNVGLNAATMWIDEYNPSTNQTLFSNSTADLPFSDPDQLLYLSANGTTEASNAYEFITGSSVPITLSFGIVGGGSGYSAPVLDYVSNGVLQNTTLTTNPTQFLMDQGSSWTVTDPLNGSSLDEKWITSQSNGTATTASTILILYTHEFLVSFNASPVDSGSVSPSTTTWYSAGSIINLYSMANQSFLFADWSANTTGITFANFTASNTTATINGSGTITGTFSLLSISLASYSSSFAAGSASSDVATIIGDNLSVTLSVSGLPSGASLNWTAGQLLVQLNGVTDAFNISTSYSTPPGSYNLTLTASSSNSSASAEFTLTVGGVDPLTVSFSTNDNTMPAAPNMTFMYDGVQNQISLSTTPRVIYVDSGSDWAVSPLLNSSSSERWIAASATDGVASGSTTIDINYFHQYMAGFTFSSANNASIAGAPPPNVTYTSMGLLSTVPANGTEVWADAGTTFNYSPTVVVSPSVRWILSGNSSGGVSKSTVSNALYLQQFLVSSSYVLYDPASTGLVSQPQLTIAGNGSTITSMLSQTGENNWIDAGSTWSATANLSSTGPERWIGTSTSGVVSSPTAIKVQYTPQFLVSLGQNLPAAGSVSGENGWYDVNSSLSISALANPGWRFESWTGTAGTLNQSSVKIEVTGPLNETAIYYTSLAISSASNGQATYTYGSNSGLVLGGSSVTLYVSPGTNVTLGASSDSAFYTPGAWSIGNDSSPAASSITVSVDSPTTVGIAFGLNLTILALIGVVIAGVIGAVLFVVLRRSAGRDLGGGASHAWKW
jgi:hypothetical protein